MLFRKGTETGQRAPARSAGTEAQLRELRVKARRRLIGALALVLAAFIVVPWLFDEPVSDDAQAPIVVPAPVAGLPPVTEPPVSQPDAAASGGTVQAEPQPEPAAPAAPESPVPSQAASQGQPPVQATPEPAPASPVRTQPEPAPEKPATEPARSAERPSQDKPATQAPAGRTDDGSVALALLAGKTPSEARTETRPAAGGRYYLQVAAYTTEQDALARRDSLRQAGVTDAYVERGQSNGRTVYRLRVGPFGSHEAAQAAQTRLRALGYQNGLISGK
ncbi:SPOR domain-containing protein [Castellaniella daejeonensis]|jgi:DedD protein|uniref:SPOR domain-containing protein n=1 Tax=Castellaniella daejeonensis TaxID=659013 RepID=A0ABN0TQV4_9BURK